MKRNIMRIPVFFSLGLAAMAAQTTNAAIVSFNYSQTTATVGAGTIGAFTFDDGGGDINFTTTAMSAATVVNPGTGLNVGSMNATSGSANETNAAVGLTWSGSVTATGTRGADVFLMDIPLVFVANQIQTPTNQNDYTWNISFGDGPVSTNDITGGGRQFAIYLSRDTVVDNTETSNMFQRYTQATPNFTAGLNAFTNTDTTTTAIKDASDGGAPTGTDAVGRDLAIYYGWRTGGSLTAGQAFVVDDFAFGGLLNTDEASLRLVPEPSAALLLVAAGAGFAFRRRRP